MSAAPHALRRYLEVSAQPASSAFHTSQVSISFGEAIDAEALRAAWETVAAAHAALRTRFAADGAAETVADPAFDWKALDWQASPPADLGVEWQALVDADAATPIAIGSAPTCRIAFIRLPNGAGHALWSFHAALLDHDSVSLVLREWLLAYDALRTGGEAPAFEDAAAPAEADDESWPSDFEGLVPPRPLIVLPLPEQPGSSAARRSVSHTFERPERAAFVETAKSLDADLRSLLGAAWAFVVARVTTSDDALLLEPARTAEGVGRIERGVVRRHRVASQKTAGDLVRDFAANVFIPPADLAAVAQKLGLPAPAIEPATSFTYRELTLNDRLRLEMPRWMAADVQLIQKTPAAITLRATATDRPEIALDYDPSRLAPAAAHTLFDLFKSTLLAFAEDPARELAKSGLPAAGAEVEGPEAPASFRSLVPQCLHELFADVAAESPDAVAIETPEEKITFSQLNASANQLSRHLRKRGIVKGARIGLAMARSPKWIAALLGALKAGAVVVPLPAGARQKTARIQAWLVDSLEEGDERDLPVIQMQADAGEIGGEKSRGVQNEAAPDSEALALAGEKAPAFTHEALAAALQSTAALLELTPADRVLQFAPTGTFAAVEEVLSTLLSGATLVLRAETRWATRTAFQEFVQESAITALSVPTPFWSQWTHYLSELSLTAPAALRVAAIAGALPSPNALAAWHAVAGSTRLLHRTAAAGRAGLAFEPGENHPFAAACLGHPVPGAIARTADSQGHPLPAGLCGRLETASHARPKDFAPLGREAFVSAEGAFYDRPRLQILVTGKSSDFPAEAIYLAAASHPEVIDAHVDQRLIAARNEWCLWIVPRDSQRGEPHDLRDWLTERLPAAPRRIRAVPRLPLDEAGEIDLAALAEILPDDAAAPATTARGSEAEEKLRRVISRVLGGRRIELDEILADGRTKPQVAKLLHEAVSREEPRVELSDFTTGFSVRSLLRNVRGRKSGAGGKWTPLQPLRASGKQPPLVFVHDFDGGSKIFAPLVAHLGADQPCYAITARGLADPAASHATVADMAAAYLEALRVFDPTGPYRLVGYGFGGLVAFEMARQLEASGAKPALLVLLATEPPASNSAIGFLSGGWKRALPALFGKKPAEETAGRRRAQETPVLRANQEAARKYAAASSALLAHVFAPTQEFPGFRAVQGGWSACCENVRIYQVPCSGQDMMAEPAVESLAEALSKLARAESLDSELEE